MIDHNDCGLKRLAATTIRISASLPSDLAEWITQQAAENKRSISNQIVWLLEQARRDTEGES